MKHLTILVPDGEGNNLSSIVGAYKIFSRANEYRRQQGKQEVFSIQLAGISKHVSFYDGLFMVQPHTHIRAITRTHLIIIPSLNHHFDQALQHNKTLVRWIEQQYRQGAEVASICTGAFLLGATGLLDGKKCSTHWSAAQAFKTRFPDVNLQADQLITDENGIYTNGGAYSFLNLIIYLIEKYYDRPTAIFCAKVFQIEMDRNSQSLFAIFTGQKAHGDEVIQKAQSFIEAKVREKFSIQDLSTRFHVGRRTFDRRFIRATGNTPVEYAQRVKVEAAKKALESGRKTVSEVMYGVGYTDAKAFREVFRRMTGLTPQEYRIRYSPAAA